ncbi:MAG TPA: glycosyltransferase family 2 protein [Nitrospiria bacterium]|jgi:glycosyltransferase involved in cell wall biosynthesis
MEKEAFEVKDREVKSLPKIIVVMPAFNAAKTLWHTFEGIPRDIVGEVILVDDASSDNTATLAERLNIKVIKHPHNVGYGGNQKTCYMEALRDGGEVVVMVHPDNQYDPRFISEIVKPILNGEAHIVLGSRMLMPGGALKGGMPMYKFIANKILSTIENVALGQSLSEFHTGYRAYSRRFLETIPFLRNSNDFDFDTQVLIQAVAFKFKIGEIPVTTKYFKDASSVNFWTSLRYGLKTLWAIFRYLLHQTKIFKVKFLLP